MPATLNKLMTKNLRVVCFSNISAGLGQLADREEGEYNDTLLFLGLETPL